MILNFIKHKAPSQLLHKIKKHQKPTHPFKNLSKLAFFLMLASHVTPTNAFEAPSTVTPQSLIPNPIQSTSLTPSPQSWSDISVYSIMVDRFANGDTTNDCANFDELIGQPKDLVHGCKAKNPFHFHGGDLRGIIEKLDYIDNMGFKAIMLTPVTKTYGEYHGYAPYNFLDVDANYGSMEDFRELVGKVHAKGMYIILDMVINHTAAVWKYDHEIPNEPPFSCRLFDESSRLPVKGWTGNKLIPEQLQDLDMFTRCGRILDFDRPFETENGDFLTYKDLASYKPEVADVMTDIFSYWIAQADVDGFRLDALKHVDVRFLQRFVPAVRDYAKTVGKHNIYFVGEAVATDYQYLNSFMGRNFVIPGQDNGYYGGIDAVYDTAAYYLSIGALKYQGRPLDKIQDLAWADINATNSFGPHALLNYRYIDLMDTRRFLDYFEQSKDSLQIALTWVFAAPGIPLVTYGTEQNLYEVKKMYDDNGDVLWNIDWLDPGLGTRVDQFPSGIYRDPKNSNQDLYSETHPTYLLIQKLNKIRNNHPALRKGTYHPYYYEKTGQGLYIFSRQFEGQEVIVAINNSKKELSQKIQISPAQSAGTWTDQIDGVTQEQSSLYLDFEELKVSVPGMSSRIYIKAK